MIWKILAHVAMFYAVYKIDRLISWAVGKVAPHAVEERQDRLWFPMAFTLGATVLTCICTAGYMYAGFGLHIVAALVGVTCVGLLVTLVVAALLEAGIRARR